MRVLITSASRKVSLVRAFRRALADWGGGAVICADVDPLSPALYEADEHCLVPRSDAPEFLATLLELCRDRGVRLLVPTRDEELAFFARHREGFERVGTRVMVASPETVELCQDKVRFIRFCAANGFEVPRTWSAPEAAAAGEFPLFAKPRFGKGGLHATRLDSPEELRRLASAVPELIVQEFVAEPEFTVDLFADFEGRVVSAVPRERMRVVGGESIVSRTRNDPAIIERSTALARALGLVGHNTIQCFARGERVRFIEVNPRFGGAASLGFAAGASTPHFLVELLREGAVAPRVGEFRDGLLMLRHTEDVFLEAGELARPYSAESAVLGGVS